MEDLVAGDLALVVSKAKPDQLRVDWRGSSTARQPKDFLAPWFEQLLAEAKATGAGIEMRFNELKYFNSATITALIHLLKSARSEQVHLEMVIDRSNHTQRQSFDALKIFARDDGLLVFRED